MLVEEDIWQEWHLRTTFSFKELGIPLTPLETKNDLYFDKEFFIKTFEKMVDDEGNPKTYLKDVFNESEVEIPILTLPKANLLLSESIRVNGKIGHRTDRIRGSYLTAAILFSLYPKDANESVFQVLRSMVSYSPAPMRKEEFLPKWSFSKKTKELQSVIKKRLQPYPEADLKALSEMFNNDMFTESLRITERLCGNFKDGFSNVALNPFLAIQDYVSLYKRTPDAFYLQGVNAILKTHLDWHESNPQLLTRVKKFLNELFWAFVKIPLEFNKEIVVSHTQKVVGIEPDKFQYAVALNDARSLHVSFQLPSNVMKFKGHKGVKRIAKRRRERIIEADVEGRWVPVKNPVSVFGRIHFSDKSVHFYTTKNQVRLENNCVTRRVRIDLKQRLSTPTRISLFVILFSIAALDIATFLTGEPALWGSLALASTLLVTFASLPREDPVFVHKARWWLRIIGGLMVAGLVAGFFSMLEHLFPGLYIWNTLWKGIFSLVGL